MVFTKLDRLGRGAHDVGATIKMLAEGRIEVIILQLGKLDLSSTAGKLMLTMMAAVAEMERDLLVERTQSSLARAKAEGKTILAWIYRSLASQRAGRAIAVEKQQLEEEAPQIRERKRAAAEATGGARRSCNGCKPSRLRQPNENLVDLARCRGRQDRSHDEATI